MVKRRVIEDVAKTIPIVSAGDVRANSEFFIIPSNFLILSSPILVKAKLSVFTSNEVSSSSQQVSFLCPVSDIGCYW